MPILFENGGATALSELSDINLSGLVANQILKYDGTAWVNVTVPETTVNWGTINGTLSNQIDLKNSLDVKLNIADKGIANGVASLGANTKVISSQLDIASVADRQAKTPNKLLDATTLIDEASMLSNANDKAPTQSSVIAYVQSQVAGALTYRGSVNQGINLTTNTTGNAYIDGITEYENADMFLVIGTGTLVFSDGSLSVTNGDAIILNKNVAKGFIVKSDVDQINTSTEVISVFGRIGTIVPQAGDYSATQVTNAVHGTITQTTVQGAIDQLEDTKISNVEIAKDNILISNAVKMNFTGDGVVVTQSLLGDANIAIAGGTSVFPATAISPASTNVTGALGASLLYAREDHKHPSEGVSTVGGNILTNGADGRAYASGRSLLDAISSARGMFAAFVTQDAKVGDIVIFDEIRIARYLSDSALTTGQINLTGGKRYFVSFAIRLESPTTAGASGWYLNVQGFQYTPPIILESMNQNSNNGALCCCTTIVAPATNAFIKISRSTIGTLSNYGRGTSITVFEI